MLARQLTGFLLSYSTKLSKEIPNAVLLSFNTLGFYPGTRKSFDHLISDSKAPKRPEMESGMTTPPKMRRVAENDYEIGELSCGD